MALLKLENLSKRYGDFSALGDISLEVAAGEFFGLLGASGAGKTTLLRLVAGLEAPGGGTIIFADENIADLAPEKRDFGMVFQNYALFPHLDVFENVAFGLKARKTNHAATKLKVAEALNLVKLSDFEKRRVGQLSGGQQQRVAIARAIAIEPRLLLFDEPLSNLDAALREETREELKELAKKLNLTTIYVTHDQDEIFALCDRVGILSGGKLLGAGTPRELYEKPPTVAAAQFLGRNNLIRALPVGSSENARLKFQTLAGEHRLFVDSNNKQNLAATDKIATLAIRPENLALAFEKPSLQGNSLKAVVRQVQHFGATARIFLDAEGLPLEALVLQFSDLKVGDVCSVNLPTDRISILRD